MTDPTANPDTGTLQAHDARTAPVLVWQMLENMTKDEL